MKHAVILVVMLGLARTACAQTMTMPGMENSVGYLSAGTSIEPKSTSESTPMVHGTVGSWTFMLHANAVLSSVQQSGPRGGDKLFSTNWVMPMLTRRFGRHEVTLRTMISLDPLTVSGRRFPQLLQTGESAYGLPIIDGQHPHDLVMELAARYDFRFSDRVQVFVYGGPVADPALGPTAFPHRASASENALAVLGHHQEDSTHIADSVVTVGFAGGPLQLEASTFRGREPNENRWNIDAGKPDSFSTRLTVGMSADLTGQFSIARLNSPEELEPGRDTVRTTASIHHHREFASGQLSSSLIWGRNREKDDKGKSIFNAYTLESTLNLRARNWFWTRIENVDRDGSLLGDAHDSPAGRVQSYSFGYERDLALPLPSVRIGIGVQLTSYGMPAAFHSIYGKSPKTLVTFLRLRPAGNMSGHMRLMHGK